MKRIPLIFAGALAFLFGAVSVAPDADARRLGGGMRHANVGKVHVRPAGVARRVTRRNVRRAGRWVNGVWVVGGVAASVAVGTASNCGYYYRKWKATGSAYWHDRYVEHCN
ncbi:hypothetical protein [Hyphomicrobium sp.]|uniref:hypothetical protein n=1 Tax=Hyphomicrobium sp. TaxID=82 RepID=UPI003F72A62F